jgi:hypothetical protein
LILVLLGAGFIAMPATATQYEGTIPSAGDDLPGLLVRYVELEKNDIVDWSWSSGNELDFIIMIPSENETVEERLGKVSQGGDLAADRSAMYMFSWYNDDPDHSVGISYTIHRVQSEPIIIGIMAIGVITFLVFVYVLWYSMRGSKKGTGTSKEGGNGGVPATGEPPEGPKKVAVIGIIASLIAISVTSFVYLPQESLDTDKGSELVLTIDNTTPDDHVIWVTTSGPGGEQVQYDNVLIAGGETGMVLILASPEWRGTGLTVELNDRTAGTKDIESWTPSKGQRDEMAYLIA